jgi:hypothetical protein
VASRRASAIISADRSTPGACGLAGAAADVEYLITGADLGRVQEREVVGGDRAVEVLGVCCPVGAFVAIPGLCLLGVGRVHPQTADDVCHLTHLLLYSLW